MAIEIVDLCWFTHKKTVIFHTYVYKRLPEARENGQFQIRWIWGYTIFRQNPTTFTKPLFLGSTPRGGRGFFHVCDLWQYMCLTLLPTVIL